MKSGILLSAAALAGLAGCVETTTDDGLGGSSDQFARMTGPCTSQASRMTGLPRGSIAVTDRIRTGGGPLLTLSASGTPYSCRMESDGSVTVFSEYAN